MRQSTDRILTTHVGSLPRSQALAEMLLKKDRGEAYDPAEYDRVISEAVTDVVATQVELGIDIPSDGEQSKISYSTYMMDRLTGFGGENERRVALDLNDYPEFREKMARMTGRQEFRRSSCIGPVAVKDLSSLHTDIRNLVSTAKDAGVEEAFMNSASPGLVTAFQPNKYYKTHEDYVWARRGRDEGGVPRDRRCRPVAAARLSRSGDGRPHRFPGSERGRLPQARRAPRRSHERRAGRHRCQPRAHAYLLGQLRRPARSRHRGGEALRRRRQGQAPGHPVRGGQCPPRARMGCVARCETARRQDPCAGHDRHLVQLCRASRARGPAHRALGRHRRARAVDRRHRLRLRHLRRLRQAGRPHRLQETAAHWPKARRIASKRLWARAA